MTDRDHQPRIELYVRSLCPRGSHRRQERVFERLDSLDETDRISGFSVTVWGRRIEAGASHTEQGRTIRTRLDEFEQWARQADVSLRSFYQSRTVESEMLGETVSAITLPVMGMAEYVDGELVHVAPCTDGDTVRSVEDRLSRLEGEPAVPAAAGGPRSRSLGEPGDD